MYHSLPPFTYIDQGTVFTRQVLPDRMHVGAGVPKRKRNGPKEEEMVQKEEWSKIRMVQKHKKWSKKKNGQKLGWSKNIRNGPKKEFAQRIVISTLSKNTYPI